MQIFLKYLKQLSQNKKYFDNTIHHFFLGK